MPPKEASKRARLWQWTIFGATPTSPPVKPTLSIGVANVLFFKFQLELGSGETGRLHYQGCTRFKCCVGLEAVKAALGAPSAHCEIARDWKALVAYCGKADTRVEGPWEEGSLGEHGKRTDLTPAVEMVMEGKPMAEVAAEHPMQIVKFGKGLAALTLLRNPPRRREHLKVYCRS